MRQRDVDTHTTVPAPIVQEHYMHSTCMYVYNECNVLYAILGSQIHTGSIFEENGDFF